MLLFILCLFLLIIIIFLQLFTKNKDIFKNNPINDNFTIVICNYNRPFNLDKSIPILQNVVPNAEIIISHGNPDTFKNYNNCVNIKQYEINNIYGATQRFFSAINSKYDKILFLDDDVIPSKNLIKKLLNHQNIDSLSISGPIIRLCNKHGYRRRFLHKYNIILTPILMTNKKILQNYLNNFNKYSNFLKDSKGNCEDLSFNHNFIINYKKQPVHISGKFKYLNTKNGYSSKNNHYKIRNNFCKLFF